VIWPAQASQFGYFDAACSKSWTANNPESIVRFLKALVQAENFDANHQKQAMTIVAGQLNYTNSYMQSVWPNYQFTVTLDQSQILAMQEEARWLISNNLTTATSTPNFLNYIYINGLESVSPESVNIIGAGD
jgi:NitT/TauT family transport system substrate-binding protein